MGRRQRGGGDNIDIERRANKKRKEALKKQQRELTKSLRQRIDDDAATSQSIRVELAKLDQIRDSSLTPQQRQLKIELSEKLDAVLQLERIRKKEEEEEELRRQKNARDGDSSSSSSSSDDDDDESDDDAGHDRGN